MYTEGPKKLVHLLNIVSVPHEHAEVTQNDVAWTRLVSEGNSHHESCRAVNKSIGVRGGGDIFSTACSKASWISSIMFISGDLGGQWKCLKSEVFLEPLGSNFRRVRCRIVLLELSQSVGMHNGHE
ncbi:hypothetical protein AVEN_188631-1 [Araneus ventricosus]|uniref:Uncharacterized protein n=1 Tax=Araneus ventricosus TaxID=182803 RepID=A0A4Y2WKB1_ARAVE|nr:hypothetical protein AVEN_188631-1 [Araneus ventricosus]